MDTETYGPYGGRKSSTYQVQFSKQYVPRDASYEKALDIGAQRFIVEYTNTTTPSQYPSLKKQMNSRYFRIDLSNKSSQRNP